MAKQKSQFLSSFGVAFQVLKSITDAVLAEGGSDDDLRSLLSDPDKCRCIALEIIGRKPMVQDGSPYRGGPSDKRDRISAPTLSASERIARAQTKLRLTYLDEGYKSYDFARDEGGKTYEVLVWAPGRYVTTAEVREHFKALEADGNAALFVDWVTENNPEGWHVSIPSDDSRLFPDGGRLYAPLFCRGDGYRELVLDHVRDEWDGSGRFVAFREVTST